MEVLCFLALAFLLVVIFIIINDSFLKGKLKKEHEDFKLTILKDWNKKLLNGELPLEAYDSLYKLLPKIKNLDKTKILPWSYKSKCLCNTQKICVVFDENKTPYILPYNLNYYHLEKKYIENGLTINNIENKLKLKELSMTYNEEQEALQESNEELKKLS